MSRREHYSTALTQSQGIPSECLSLFEIWQEGMSANQLFDLVQTTNALNLDSERRLRNVVIEGFGSRFLPFEAGDEVDDEATATFSDVEGAVTALSWYAAYSRCPCLL